MGEWTRRKMEEAIQQQDDVKQDVSDLKSQQIQTEKVTEENSIKSQNLKKKVNDIDTNVKTRNKLSGIINKYIFDNISKHADQNHKAEQRLNTAEGNINEGIGMIETLKEVQSKANETMGNKLNHTISN